MLQIYNTLTKQEELFKPITPKKIGIYVCGLTSYDDCHLGHARAFICFDMIVKYLRFLGFSVTFVRNITDIDDKIIRRAQELHEEYHQLTQRYIDSMHADTAALGITPPDFEPRVTEHIPEIIQMIQALISLGYAYTTTQGDVYYSVNKFKNYGNLAHQDIDSLRSGVRIEINDNKIDPLDFALWKAAKPNEPSWESPWGNGRPGWHIECSVMSKLYLGEHFDIHGGGADLQFPHHQNELAQSEAANNCKFVNYWMHVGLVQIDHEKMSKSLGNFFTIKDALTKYDPEVIRYFMLQSHYRSPVNYATDNMESAEAALQRLYFAIRDLPSVSIKDNSDPRNFKTKFLSAMNDDFNTPEALAVLFEIAREINRLKDTKQLSHAAYYATLLKELCEIFGFLQKSPDDFLGTKIGSPEISALIQARDDARKNKDWALADKLRDELLALGIVLEDSSQGTKWRKI
ncbi:MAG: cysteine--tRNA ligase [Gammaproteobacteria bacterium]|nr:cysteine--tRNA ligase [Gammaproteobacteria bacterium]